MNDTYLGSTTLTFADLYRVAPFPWRMNAGVTLPITPAVPSVLDVRAVLPERNGDGLTVVVWKTRKCWFAEEYQNGRFQKRIPMPLEEVE